MALNAASAGRLMGCLLVAFLLVSSSNAAKPAAKKPKRHPARLIVRFKEGRVAAAASGTGKVKPIAAELNMFTLEIQDGTTPEEKVAQLQKMSGVLYAEVDDVVEAATARHSMPSRRRLHAASPPPQAAARRPPPPARRSPPPPVKAAATSPPPATRSPPPPLVKRPPPSPKPRRPPPPLVRRPPPPAARGDAASSQFNDPLMKDQWGLFKVRAPQAWAYAKDATSVLVCIVDSGVKWNHPDLAPNLLPADDAYKAAHTDDFGHGTHVAGIIGAVGNNALGVAGTAPKTQMLACKALDEYGYGYVSDVVNCIQMCRSKGARIINTSLVLPFYNAPMDDAFRSGTEAGVFFASAAGNSLNDNDLAQYYPGGYGYNGSVAVANLEQANQGQLHWDSNYGAKTVHLAAPGTEILSTSFVPNADGQYYAYMTGSSMAAPHVTGAAALALAASGGKLTNGQLQDLLIATSQPLPALQGKVLSNGVIDIERLILAALQRAASG